MKEFGQSIVKGAVLILGFVVLIIALSSLPGGQPGPAPAPEPAVQSQAQPSAPASPTQRVPSSVRGASPTQAPAPASATPASGQSQRSRLNRPQPAESEAEMHHRISSYLDNH